MDVYYLQILVNKHDLFLHTYSLIYNLSTLQGLLCRVISINTYFRLKILTFKRLKVTGPAIFAKLLVQKAPVFKKLFFIFLKLFYQLIYGITQYCKFLLYEYARMLVSFLNNGDKCTMYIQPNPEFKNRFKKYHLVCLKNP